MSLRALKIKIGFRGPLLKPFHPKTLSPTLNSEYKPSKFGADGCLALSPAREDDKVTFPVD